MKTAITVWGKWISPVFDSASTILIADIEKGAIENRQLLNVETDSPIALAKLLKGQGVTVLICGAISEYPAKILEGESLQLVPFITGNAETILETLARGRPIVPLYLMPGCKIRNLLNQAGGNTDSPRKRCCAQGKQTSAKRR